MQVVQYMDLRHTIDINPPTFHYVTYKVSVLLLNDHQTLHPFVKNNPPFDMGISPLVRRCDC